MPNKLWTPSTFLTQQGVKRVTKPKILKRCREGTAPKPYLEKVAEQPALDLNPNTYF
jgi:hypothetical protein